MAFHERTSTVIDLTDDSGNGIVVTANGTTLTFVIADGKNSVSFNESVKADAQSFAAALTTAANALP